MTTSQKNKGKDNAKRKLMRIFCFLEVNHKRPNGLAETLHNVLFYSSLIQLEFSARISLFSSSSSLFLLHVFVNWLNKRLKLLIKTFTTKSKKKKNILLILIFCLYNLTFIKPKRLGRFKLYAYAKRHMYLL